MRQYAPCIQIIRIIIIIIKKIKINKRHKKRKRKKKRQKETAWERREHRRDIFIFIFSSLRFLFRFTEIGP